MIGCLLTGVALMETSDRLLDRIEIGAGDDTASSCGDARRGTDGSTDRTGDTPDVGVDDELTPTADSEKQDDHRLEVKAFADAISNR